MSNIINIANGKMTYIQELSAKLRPIDVHSERVRIRVVLTGGKMDEVRSISTEISVHRLHAMSQEFAKQDVVNLAGEHGWTQLCPAEVPYYQHQDAKTGRITRWLRIRNPELTGVVEYITVYWDEHGLWTGRAISERYKCGVSIPTGYIRPKPWRSDSVAL